MEYYEYAMDSLSFGTRARAGHVAKLCTGQMLSARASGLAVL